MAQYSTFFLEGHLYGLPVEKVQEVVRPLPVTGVPLSPEFVVGLVNLRGQVVTVIGLRQLFGLPQRVVEDRMYVVCPSDGGGLVAFEVDAVGDVLDVVESEMGPIPETMFKGVKEFLGGMYRISSGLLNVIDMSAVTKCLLSVSKK